MTFAELLCPSCALFLDFDGTLVDIAPQPEAVFLVDLVESVIAPYQLRAEQVGVRLQLAPMPHAQLWIDRLQMEVVLRSLLANAFDSVSASPRQPRAALLSTRFGGEENTSPVQ